MGHSHCRVLRKTTPWGYVTIPLCPTAESITAAFWTCGKSYRSHAFWWKEDDTECLTKSNTMTHTKEIPSNMLRDLLQLWVGVFFLQTDLPLYLPDFLYCCCCFCSLLSGCNLPSESDKTPANKNKEISSNHHPIPLTVFPLHLFMLGLQKQTWASVTRLNLF